MRKSNKQAEKLWTKDFILVSLINFLLTLIFYLLIVIIAVYSTDKFQASVSQAGLVTGIFIIGTLLGRLFIGRVIDDIGRKKTLFIGLTAFVFTTLLYFVSFTLPLLLLIRFLHGVSLGIASTATGTIVAQIIPDRKKAEGIGYYSMSAALATAIGPFTGLFMMQHTNFELIFLLCTLLSVVCFSVAFLVEVPALPILTTSTKEKKFSLADFVEPKALPIALVAFIVALCYSSVLSFINSYAIEINLVSTASFFFIVYAVAVLVSRPFTGQLLDIKGANYVMYPAFVFFVIGLITLSFTHSSFSLLLSGVFIGLGFGNLQSSTQAIAIKLTEPHRMGLATSTFFIFLDGGLGFGPYLLGFVIPIIGFRKLYIVLGFVVLLTALIYHFLHGKHSLKIVSSISKNNA